MSDDAILAASIRVKRLDPRAEIPTHATAGAAAVDLRALLDKSTPILPGDQTIIGTGIAMAIPAGHCLLLFSRSGHGFKNGVRLANAVGVVDPDFVGEIKVCLRNDGRSALWLEQGDRIAQALLVKLPSIHFVEVDELPATDRGAGGFGSTGVK